MEISCFAKTRWKLSWGFESAISFFFNVWLVSSHTLTSDSPDKGSSVALSWMKARWQRIRNLIYKFLHLLLFVVQSEFLPLEWRFHTFYSIPEGVKAWGVVHPRWQQDDTRWQIVQLVKQTKADKIFKKNCLCNQNSFQLDWIVSLAWQPSTAVMMGNFARRDLCSNICHPTCD